MRLPARWDPRRRREAPAEPVPEEKDGLVTLDAELAVLVEEVTVSRVETGNDEPDVFALELTGHLNRTGERIWSLFLLKPRHVALAQAGFLLALKPPEEEEHPEPSDRSTEPTEDLANG